MFQKVWKALSVTVTAIELWRSPRLWLDSCLPCLSTKRLASYLFALSSHANGSRSINPVAMAIVSAVWQQTLGSTEETDYQVFKSLLSWKNPVKANRKFTCAEHFRSSSRNSFFQRSSSTYLAALHCDCTAPASAPASRRSCWWRGRTTQTWKEMQNKPKGSHPTGRVQPCIPKLCHPSLWGAP